MRPWKPVWACHSGGRFVEIGKAADQPIGRLPFRRNLSFYGVDLALMCATHPDQIRELLNTVYRLAAKGVLPQPESTHYPLTEAAAALRTMSAAEHTGKLILSVPRVGHSSVVVPPEQAQVFRPDGAYIVTGGLGGLGLFLAAKMAKAGAGRIVLNSRSAPKAAAIAEIAQMRAQGAEVEVVTGDIALVGTVDRLVAEATASGLPVRGVLHAAAVVEDAIPTNISGELIERDWAPKVYGAWHLHRATATQPLDWFCSFSSAAALIGSPGQGACRRCQQLARRLHSVAACAGSAGHDGRLGGMGRDRCGQAPGRVRCHRDDRSGRGCPRLRGGAAAS